MKSTINRLKDGTVEITLNIPWSEIQSTYTIVITEMSKNIELKGFRKGKAPLKIIEESLDKNKIYEEVLKNLLPKVYSQAVKENDIHPIIVPKINLKEAKENTDWVIVALTCEKPNVDLGNYKEQIKIRKASPPKKIWVPGESDKRDDKEKDSKMTLDQLLTILLESVKADIPHILLEQEVNRLLSDLIDQTKKLGLTVDQYLSSTHKTADTIRLEYEDQARKSLILEFSLEKIADIENIMISDDDINNAINSAKSEEEKTALSKEKYYLASVLKRQKTLDFLATL